MIFLLQPTTDEILLKLPALVNSDTLNVRLLPEYDGNNVTLGDVTHYNRSVGYGDVDSIGEDGLANYINGFIGNEVQVSEVDGYKKLIALISDRDVPHLVLQGANDIVHLVKLPSHVNIKSTPIRNKSPTRDRSTDNDDYQYDYRLPLNVGRSRSTSKVGIEIEFTLSNVTWSMLYDLTIDTTVKSITRYNARFKVTNGTNVSIVKAMLQLGYRNRMDMDLERGTSHGRMMTISPTSGSSALGNRFDTGNNETTYVSEAPMTLEPNSDIYMNLITVANVPVTLRYNVLMDTSSWSDIKHPRLEALVTNADEMLKISAPGIMHMKWIMRNDIVHDVHSVHPGIVANNGIITFPGKHSEDIILKVDNPIIEVKQTEEYNGRVKITSYNISIHTGRDLTSDTLTFSHSHRYGEGVEAKVIVSDDTSHAKLKMNRSSDILSLTMKVETNKSYIIAYSLYSTYMY